MKKITTLFVLLMLCCISKWTNAQYVPPTHIDGAAPNGILWDSVLTGRTLPVRTSTVGFSGAPGAVMFYDKATGIIGINPNGLSINFIVVTYTSGNINTTANTPGPFIYGGNTTTNAYSPSIGTPRTFPAVTAVAGLPPTTHRARFGGSIGSPLGPSLATTGNANNIASTDGFLNLPWSFGKVVNIDSLIANNQALADSNFKVVGQASNANANLLGYGAPWGTNGNIRGVFQYSANGIVGNQVGPVIVYSSVPTCTAPTLSSIINNTSCSSLNDGSINLTATNGSPAPTFAWSGPNSFTATTEDLSALAAGSYTVIATSGTCTSTATYTVVAGAQPTMPTLACYETATFNSTTCSWDVTGTPPTQPTLACYQTASFNTTSCQWDVTGTPPTQPTGLACYETLTLNNTSCSWDISGSQPVQPTLACYQSANFNTTTCSWDVTGTQPVQPTGLACYETLTLNNTTCSWDVTGSQPTQPTLACYESANFNTGTCSWVVTGTQPLAPTGLACYETATFNTTSCSWDVTGSVPAPIVTIANACNSYTWSVNSQTYTQSGSYTSVINCATEILNLTIQNIDTLSGFIPNPAVFPGGGQTSNIFNTTVRRIQCFYDSTNWIGQGVSGPIKITKFDFRALAAVTQSRTYSSVEIHLQQANVDHLTPSTTFANNRTSALGTPNYAGAITVNAGDSSDYLIQVPLTKPFTYDPTKGDLLVELVFLSTPSPLGATIIDAGFSALNHKCNSVRSQGSTTATAGSISAFAPILRTAYIPLGVNVSTCGSYNWNINGQTYTQSGIYTGVNTCGDTLTLNLTIKPSSTSSTTESAIGSYTWNGNTYTTSGTYTWTGTNSVGCDSVATLNLTILSNCIPTSSTETITACSSYLFNGTSYTASGTYTWTGTNAAGCDSVVTLNLTITPQPAQPSLACYETATFNSTTCQWDVTGTQPAQPSLACYESANFNTGTCSWDVTGTQPLAPTGLACYETTTFNTTTCSWDVTGSAPAAIVTTTTGCDSYTWSANGQAYTQSGTYSYFANCQDYTLNLTITTSTVYYADVDGDGYGNATVTTLACNGAPNSYAAQSGDCNDTSATAYPGASEICGNGIDDDCDSQIDEGASVFANPIAGNLKVCGLYAGATTLTTTPIEGSSTYNWTVPSDMTITSGQGTTTITVFWDNIYLLQNGIVGNVTVTPVLSTAGCSTVVPASIPVDLQYTAPVTPPSISGPNAICPNESGIYSIALVNRASSYEWTLPTGASITSGLASNIINVSYANGFTGGNISVRSKNVCGLSISSRNRYVKLNLLPAPASITGPINGLCNATNANYFATAVVGATGYNWTVPVNGSINGGSNSNNISTTFNSSFTTGNITVAAVNNCGVGATRSLAVKSVPATPGTITGPATACTGSSQSYSISPVQGASNYAWTVPGGAVINSGQGTKNLNLNFGSTASANGIITVKSSNSCGTSTAKVLAVVTSGCPRLGDTVTQLQVYPNPANSYINLSFNVEQSHQATIILRDAAGRIVYNEAIDAIAGFNNQQIVVSNLAKGVYFVQLQTSDSSENTRLIVE